MDNEREEMISSEETTPQGAGAARSRRRLLPGWMLLAGMLACGWLSASTLMQTLESGQPMGGSSNHGVAPLGASALADQPTPTHRSGSQDPAPASPEVIVLALGSPTPLTASGTGEDPQAPPDLPAATPTGTPVTPTATPVTPTATPVTPTATPQCLSDIYESDNTFAQAQTISTDGVRQCHVNTQRVEVVSGTPVVVQDEDWVKFGAVTGHAYTIGTQLVNDINQSDTAANDTLLYLYGTNGTTQLAFNDDVTYTTWYLGYYYYRESLLQWTAPADGLYFVRELQWGPTAGYTIRDEHRYWLWVEDLTTPAPLAAALMSSETPAAVPPEATPSPEPTSSPPAETPMPTDPPATESPEPPAGTPEPSPSP